MNKLAIICGSPAAGKSTFARKLAAESKATVLDTDTCSEAIIKVALQEAGRSPDDRDSNYFKDTYRAVIYESVFAVAAENLAYNNVIIVGPFTREIRDPAWLSELKNRFCADVTVYYVYCKPQIRKARMAGRGQARDLAKLEKWEDKQAYYGDEIAPAFAHVFIDNS